MMSCSPHEHTSLGRVITVGRIYSLNFRAGLCAKRLHLFKWSTGFSCQKRSSAGLLLPPDPWANSLNHILTFKHQDANSTFSGKYTATTTMTWGFFMQMHLLSKVNVIKNEKWGMLITCPQSKSEVDLFILVLWKASCFKSIYDFV